MMVSISKAVSFKPNNAPRSLVPGLVLGLALPSHQLVAPPLSTTPSLWLCLTCPTHTRARYTVPLKL